jgi:hypothetical protein
MTITNGVEIKHISLYPPAKSVNELEHVKWLNEIDTNDEIIQPILTIAQALNLKENTDENQFNHFISHPDFPLYFRGKDNKF